MTVKCDCGCGEEIVRSRPWHRFVDNKHRDRYHNKMRQLAYRTLLDRGELPASEEE